MKAGSIFTDESIEHSEIRVRAPRNVFIDILGVTSPLSSSIRTSSSPYHASTSKRRYDDIDEAGDLVDVVSAVSSPRPIKPLVVYSDAATLTDPLLNAHTADHPNIVAPVLVEEVVREPEPKRRRVNYKQAMVTGSIGFMTGAVAMFVGLGVLGSSSV